MTTQEGRANELYFILRYGYNVPDDVLDKIDLYAYADPHLTVTENLRILLNYFPALRSYVDLSRLYDAERYAREWRDYLIDTLRRALEGDTTDMEMLGFTDPDEFARALIEEGIITEEEYRIMKGVEEDLVKKAEKYKKVRSDTTFRKKARALGWRVKGGQVYGGNYSFEAEHKGMKLSIDIWEREDGLADVRIFDANDNVIVDVTVPKDLKFAVPLAVMEELSGGVEEKEKDFWEEVREFIEKKLDIPVTYPAPMVTFAELEDLARRFGLNISGEEIAMRLVEEQLARFEPQGRPWVRLLWLEEDDLCDSDECLVRVRWALALAKMLEKADEHTRDLYLPALTEFCTRLEREKKPVWPKPEPIERSVLFVYQRTGGLKWKDLINVHSFCRQLRGLGYKTEYVERIEAGGGILKEAEEVLRQARELGVQPYLSMVEAGYTQLKAAVEHGEVEQAREILDKMKEHLEKMRKRACNITPYITFVPRDNGVLIKRVDFGDPRKGTAPAVLKILERLNLSYDRPTFYIFEGPLLAYNRLKYEKFVPNGTYLLLSRGTGSWRHPETTVYLLQVRGGKVCELVKARWPDEWMEFIDEVKKYVPSEVRPQEQVEEVREEETKPPETPEEARPEERAEAREEEEVPETLQFIKHKLTSAFKAKLLDLGVPREEWDEYVRRAEKAIEFDASAVYHGKVPQEVAMLGVMQMAEKLVKGEPVKAGPIEVKPPEEAVEKSKPERAAELTRRLMEYVRQKYPDYDIYLRDYVKDLAAELAKEPGSISDLFEEGKARVDEYVENSKPVLDVAAELGLTAPEFEALLEKVRENLVSFLMLPESEKKKALKAWAEKITQPKPRKAEIRYRAEEIWERKRPKWLEGFPPLPPEEEEEEEGPKVKPSEELFEGLPELTKKPPERAPVKDIADILAEPENLVQILVFGLNYWLNQASKRIPGLKAIPYDEVISALTAILNRALRNLENPTTLVDWLAYTVLSKFMASAMEGLTSLWKAAWPDIRVELKAMAIEGDPVAKATERLLEEYKYVCWKHLGGDKYDVKIGDRVKGYRCERLSRAFLYMYIPPVLRALGVEDVKRYIPQPIRDIIVAEYNLLKEYFRRAL